MNVKLSKKSSWVLKKSLLVVGKSIEKSSYISESHDILQKDILGSKKDILCSEKTFYAQNSHNSQE
jgi:hypothetical protein